MQGLDIVRRDWSELAKDIGEEVVQLILTPDLDRDALVERIVTRLAELRRHLDECLQNPAEMKRVLEKFEILKVFAFFPKIMIFEIE